MNILTLPIFCQIFIVCLFFIDKYFERNAMNLRKKMTKRNWLSVIQRQFDLENLIYWKRGREKYDCFFLCLTTADCRP